MFLLLRYLPLLFSLFLISCVSARHDGLPEIQTGTLQQPFEISGVLQKDTRAAGVIRVTGDLLIPQGRRLQIESGSRVTILGNDSTKIDPEFLDKGTEILVKGSLHLLGQQGAPVTLTLDEATPKGENWAGLELLEAESAIFRHVDIIGAEIGILSINSSPKLEQVNILGARYGLLLQGAGDLDYKRGRISGGDAGLLCFDHAQMQLNDVQIVDNLEEGLYLATGCTLDQLDLQIVRNDIGVVAGEDHRSSLSSVLNANRIDFKALSSVGQDQ